MANEVARGITLNQYEDMVKQMLDTKLDENSGAVPEDMNKKRFALNCIAVFKDDPQKFNKCSPETLVATFMEGAYLGLDFFNKECYAIPYGSVVNFQTDYKGERKLAKKYSAQPIKDIYAKVVREGDEFIEQIVNGEQSVSFKPEPFSNKPIIGAFAVALFKDGSMLYETMSKEEIEGVRNSFSKAANGKAWKNTPGEMYKKTVLRRLLKGIDLVFENAKQDRAFNDGGDFDEKRAKEVVDVVETKDIFTVEDKPLPPDPANADPFIDEPQVVMAEEVVPDVVVDSGSADDEYAAFEAAYERGDA